MASSFGDLYLLPNAGFSRRVILVIRHCRPARIALRVYHVFFTRLFLWFSGRVKRSDKVTSPTLVPPSGDAVMHSHAIARALDARRFRDVPTLFPVEHDIELRALVEASDTVTHFARATMFAYTMEHPHVAARLFFPRWLRAMPFAPSLAGAMIRSFAAKYAIESSKAGVDDARRALQVIADAVKRSGKDGFLVGGRLTFADYTVALALPFLEQRSKKWKMLPVHPIGDEFPQVRDWGNAFIKRFVRYEDVAWPIPTFDENGLVC